ncbi:MAG: hypothetical protein H8D37_06190 [Chloroflexi bacterium]|nr:hypothetical protein [Chloroflexota bacterium]
MWKEEEHGNETINANRFREAQETEAEILAVGCPFCMMMLNDAAKDANATRGRSSSTMQVLDVAEIVAAQLKR